MGIKSVITKIKKFFKMQTKDTRGELEAEVERKEERKPGKRKKAKGLIATVLAGAIGAYCALGLPGCEKKIPGEREPVAQVGAPYRQKYNVYKIHTSKGERFVNFFPNRRLLDYNGKKRVFKVYDKWDNKIEEIPVRLFKFYKSVEELKEALKKEKGMPVYLTR